MMPDKLLGRISTPRLNLIAATVDHLLADLESSDRLAAMLGAEIGPGWPPGDFTRRGQAYFCRWLREDGEESIGWYAWYAVRRGAADQPAVVVGVAAFMGPPEKNGEVEIAYSIVPSFERQGYATEIVESLVEFAFADPRVLRVVAKTKPTNQGSIAVLTKAGFLQVSGVDDRGYIHFERDC